jgi:hypothetical protein
MGSPYDDKTGIGNYLRPTATDLGKGKTTKEDEIKIKALMGPRAKHHLRPQDGSHRLIVNV